MILHPCLTCSFSKKCEKEHLLKKKLKGTGLTTCSFPCKKKWAQFQPGMRISATFTVYDYNVAEDIEISGTIMRMSRKHSHKCLVWLDEPVRGEIVRVHLFQNRMTPLDEPQVKICEECGRPENRENKEGWYCGTCHPEMKEEDWYYDETSRKLPPYKKKRKKSQRRERKQPEMTTMVSILARTLSTE